MYCLGVTSSKEPPTSLNAVLLDGAATVHSLKPNYVKTLDCMLRNEMQVEPVDRLDIIWDVHVEGSLKESALKQTETI